MKSAISLWSIVVSFSKSLFSCCKGPSIQLWASESGGANQEERVRRSESGGTSQKKRIRRNESEEASQEEPVGWPASSASGTNGLGMLKCTLASSVTDSSSIAAQSVRIFSHTPTSPGYTRNKTGKDRTSSRNYFYFYLSGKGCGRDRAERAARAKLLQSEYGERMTCSCWTVRSPQLTISRLPLTRNDVSLRRASL